MTPEQDAKLRAEFPKDTIGKLPKGGVTLDYIGHAAVTDRLLSVDPEWSWEPMALDDRGLPALDREGNLWIRLTIAGTTRPGVGDGRNMKERIGDALRNGAMRFGVALTLWTKDELESDVAERQAQPPRAHLVVAPDAPDLVMDTRTGEVHVLDKPTDEDKGRHPSKGVSPTERVAEIKANVTGEPAPINNTILRDIHSQGALLGPEYKGDAGHELLRKMGNEFLDLVAETSMKEWTADQGKAFVKELVRRVREIKQGAQ